MNVLQPILLVGTFLALLSVNTLWASDQAGARAISGDAARPAAPIRRQSMLGEFGTSNRLVIPRTNRPPSRLRYQSALPRDEARSASTTHRADYLGHLHLLVPQPQPAVAPRPVQEFRAHHHPGRSYSGTGYVPPSARIPVPANTSSARPVRKFLGWLAALGSLAAYGLGRQRKNP